MKRFSRSEQLQQFQPSNHSAVNAQKKPDITAETKITIHISAGYLAGRYDALAKQMFKSNLQTGSLKQAERFSSSLVMQN